MGIFVHILSSRIPLVIGNADKNDLLTFHRDSPVMQELRAVGIPQGCMPNGAGAVPNALPMPKREDLTFPIPTVCFCQNKNKSAKSRRKFITFCGFGCIFFPVC